MADDRGPARDYPAWRPKPASWTKLFGTFFHALDYRKLLLAALGILFTSLGWWIISWIFYGCWSEPRFDEYQRESKDQSKLKTEEERDSWARTEYARAMDRWALVHELAGSSTTPNAKFEAYYKERHPETAGRNVRMAEGYGGKYRTMPWSENRGPNPFLMTRTVVSGSGPERREVLGQFATYQLPNLVEPLLKFLGPVYYFFDPRADFWIHLYLVLLILWFLVVWGFFGGVITRMTVFQLTGKEGGGVFDSIAFVRRRFVSYLLSPMIPLGLIAFFVLLCFLFGLIHWIPGFGDIWDGILWILPLLAGVAITLLLIGMFGYPMMYTTLSVEGSDTFDAMSRSYNYVYESPWHYLWYSLVALAYGAIVVLFVIIVGSLTAYLAKWGVKQAPTTERSPEFLFIYAPESLGWQKLLTEGSDVAVDDYGRPADPERYYNYLSTYWMTNKIGAFLCSFWVTVLFMFVIGFSYSYFWTAATQIYLLMRKRVDETEMDEVYIEEELPEPPLSPPVSPTPAPTPTPTGPVSVPVDAPTLRQPEPPVPASPPPSTPPPAAPPETPGDSKPPAP